AARARTVPGAGTRQDHRASSGHGNAGGRRHVERDAGRRELTYTQGQGDSMNRQRLFVASCIALVTTSMVFSIRGDILDALGRHFHLNNHQLGVILSPAFWGFTVSIMLGGSLVDFFGMRQLFLLSSGGYIGS